VTRQTWRDPAGPRPFLVGGFALGLVLLAIAYFTFFSVHNLWEVPLGLYLVVACMGKMVAR
jgi:hypothetical protein